MSLLQPKACASNAAGGLSSRAWPVRVARRPGGGYRSVRGKKICLLSVLAGSLPRRDGAARRRTGDSGQLSAAPPRCCRVTGWFAADRGGERGTWCAPGAHPPGGPWRPRTPRSPSSASATTGTTWCRTVGWPAAARRGGAGPGGAPGPVADQPTAEQDAVTRELVLARLRASRRTAARSCLPPMIRKSSRAATRWSASPGTCPRAPAC